MKKTEKTKLAVTGSNSLELKEVPAVSEEASKPAKENKDLAEDLFKQILDATMVESLLKESFDDPGCIVQSEDGSPLWLLSLTTRSFRMIPNKTEIAMIDKIDDNISHCLILNDLYEVKNKLIKEIGWN